MQETSMGKPVAKLKVMCARSMHEVVTALAYDFIRAIGREAGDSRIWAGIHFPMDNTSGHQLGLSIAQVFIAWAQTDGSQ